jgi:hypothetical protein
MAFCGKINDILVACDTSNLNMASGALIVPWEALSKTYNATKPFLLDKLELKDPNTGSYPVAGSPYLPIKAEWYLNSVVPNYEVVVGTSKKDTFKQTIGKLIITNSETPEGKETASGLNAGLWVVISKMKGVSDEKDTFHVFGIDQGLKFLPEPTSAEFGNRVVGSFTSIDGSEESTPAGVNWLDTDAPTTNALFNQRLAPVIVP